MLNKKHIRKALGKFPLALQLLCARLILWFESVVQWRRASKLKRLGMQEFVASLDRFDSSLECHILASGWSLNHSYETIDRAKSFVIGFNFSFLKCNDPDLHFIENASVKDLRFFVNTYQTYFALGKFNVFANSKVVFKNLSELKNSVHLIGMLYSDKAFFIKDRHFRIFGSKGVAPVMTQMCAETQGLPQAVSSVVGLAVLAKMLGFKRVIVHGLDFQGPHFYGYDASDIIFNNGALPQPLNPDEAGFELHKTAIGENGVGVASVIKALKYELKKYDVDILAASKLSPSAGILGAAELE
ncbi:hypothetical protein [Pseudomonas sp. NFACC13-1]|uniref:hypothetical protein n=1 Tax=Pseudomonas sp. NFACC13-1 TaxID=1566245 RepID=UPI000887B822|nr:hypothetical protein [Pseudomonas sp. NFACC13-1]SDB16406.1 hypothetical protein SAMN03159290_01202 [Pseudomonas sp. NFACC13-1]